MIENNLPENKQVPSSEDIKAQESPVAASTVVPTDTMTVTEESNGGMLSHQPQAPNNSSSDEQQEEYVVVSHVSEQKISESSSSANQQNENKIMDVNLGSKNKSGGVLITGLLVVWVILGGYYFFGGNLDLNFLKGDVSSEKSDFLSDLPNLVDTDLDISIDSSNTLNLEDENLETETEKDVNALDSFDKMFLGADERSSNVEGKVKGVKTTYAEELEYADNDADGDGLADVTEEVLGTNPSKIDTDGDGLSDYQEVGIYRTDPLKLDTDNDGSDDNIELANGSDPLRYKL